MFGQSKKKKQTTIFEQMMWMLQDNILVMYDWLLKHFGSVDRKNTGVLSIPLWVQDLDT